MSEMQEKLLTAAEVAAVLGVRVRTIYDAVVAEKIPHVEMLILRFREADVIEILASRTLPGPPVIPAGVVSS